MNKKLRNYNEDGLRLRNKRRYLLQKLYLLELKKRQQEELYEYYKLKK